jgi:hypothetical protein
MKRIKQQHEFESKLKLINLKIKQLEDDKGLAARTAARVSTTMHLYILYILTCYNCTCTHTYALSCSCLLLQRELLRGFKNHPVLLPGTVRLASMQSDSIHVMHHGDMIVSNNITAVLIGECSSVRLNELYAKLEVAYTDSQIHKLAQSFALTHAMTAVVQCT